MWYVCRHLASAFPNRLSDNRLVAVIPTALVPRCVYLQTRNRLATGIACIDATARVVCHNRRIQSYQVFKHVARRGKTSVGWFDGFKLHRGVKDRGDLLAFQMTPGNTDDRQSGPRWVQGLTGNWFGDRGYISQKLFETRLEQNLPLITQLRNTMRNKLLPLADQLVLRKRALSETIHAPLKHLSPIEPTRHRRGVNAMVHLLAGLGAYPHQPKKRLFGNLRCWLPAGMLLIIKQIFHSLSGR